MFETEIAAASSKYGIPIPWIQAVIDVESSWNAAAFNPNDPGGAYGLMQITGQTAGAYGVNPLTLFDAGVNIDLGTHILADNRDICGDDFRDVYSMYNSGSCGLWHTSSQVAGNVNRAVNALEYWQAQQPGGGSGLSSTAILVGAVAVLFLLSR